MDRLLAARNLMKKKKPGFKRQDANKYKQFRDSWRRPRGIHNKLKAGFKGHNAVPSIGWGSPRAVKGLTTKGLEPIVVNNVSELQKVSEKNLAIISRRVGIRKRLEIVKAAKEKKINISGVKDFDSYINKIIESRKKEDVKAEKNESSK